MTAVTGRDQRAQTRSDTTRATLARRRRNLLFPILLLVAVSLAAVVGLLVWSAQSVNDHDALAQEDLVRSVLQVRKESLRQVVIHYALWHDDIAAVDGNVAIAGARQDLPAYLQRALGIAAGWVVAPDGEIRFGFENGREIAPQMAPLLPQASDMLVETARKDRSIDLIPPAGFALYQQDLALISASVVAPLHNLAGSTARAGDVMVFVQPLDLSFFARAGVGAHLENLHFIRGAVPQGYLGCTIKDIEGTVLGSIIWLDNRSGDAVLWNLVPILLVALVAVGILLVLAIKRVETVLSREGRLSISLLQEKQRRSQKSSFVSMVSHELRTPLQAIGTAADMLERFGDQMNESERREETKTIRQAVSTLARLVDDILVMGRAEAMDSSVRRDPVDLGRLCRAVWREVSIALGSKQNMVLKDEIGGAITGVSETALHTVLSNLMQNAIKYSRGEGDVEVELRRSGAGYLVAVTDHGPGVGPEEREAIFQPYWRSRLVDGIAGTGLGLPVARSAARSMGGDLTVESADGHEGARFVLRWPFSA